MVILLLGKYLFKSALAWIQAHLHHCMHWNNSEALHASKLLAKILSPFNAMEFNLSMPLQAVRLRCETKINMQTNC